ncbi:MAG: TIGR04282 family arsenosugar biosynthesis glycosyltransferase [Chitinophagaceae bacterium]
MLKKALIIFVKNPIEGKVKTRLAKTIGNTKALLIYKHLLAHTVLITSGIVCNKFVYYAGLVDDTDHWDNTRYEKKLQEGVDLGARMANAFKDIFHAGYHQAIIIGSDCYQLSTAIINDALVQLQDTDAVLGPSEDGGYYLIGLKTMQESLFKEKSWSSENVCSETITEFQKTGMSYSLLPVLNDVDVEADLDEDLRRLIK